MRPLLQKLSEPIDNTPLILFRVAFGFLLFLESAGAIVTGWVKKTLVDPKFTFSFVGFDWLQPLPGNGMYYYYGLMAVLGVLIMLGFYYKTSMVGFTILWTITYWMQTTHYNNHYYLLILLCLFMCILPAHKYYSLDTKLRGISSELTCPRWCTWIFIFQLWIVFTYASIAKLYSGWIDGDFISLILASKKSYLIIGEFLQNSVLQRTIVWGGILFDALVVYLLLYKRTRIIAFVISIVFHLFNSIVFQIGIFPYLMIALCVFFFSSEELKKVFFKSKPATTQRNSIASKTPKIAFTMLGLYFIVQLALPLRHYLFEGNVYWTGEGHKMSWRMMLLLRGGTAEFKVVDSITKQEYDVDLSDHLSRGQRRKLAGHPDMIWKFAQYLKKHFKEKGVDGVEVYVETRVRLNKNNFRITIDPNMDLANVEWDHFRHKPWIYSFD